MRATSPRAAILALLILVLPLLASNCGSAREHELTIPSAQIDKRKRSYSPPVTRPAAPRGLHGTGLIAVNALPGLQELSVDTENTVIATTDLGFAVTLEDMGDSQEVQFKVVLTIQQTPSPIVQTRTVDLINPGERKTVMFRNLGQVQFATRSVLKVDIQPVPGEKNTANNSAEYPVIFSLG